MGIGDQLSQPVRTVPGCERGAVGQRLQLANPDLSLQDERRVGAAEVLFFSELDGTLAYLYGIVLDPNDIGSVIAFQILNANLTSEHSRSEFVGRAAQFSRAGGMAFFYCLAFDAVSHVLNVELETRVAFVVDGDAPGKVVPVGLLESENVGHAVM